MQRKVIVTIGLCFIAVIPVVIGTFQAVDFLSWVFDKDIISFRAKQTIDNSMLFLVFTFVISLLERFCFYHRLTICATLYTNCSCFFMECYPSTLFYNITNLVAVMFIIAGISGCIIHFIYQIYDFKRYIRIRKQE